MSSLPAVGFLRLKQIIGNPKAKPPVPALIPVKKTCWYEGIKAGKFPKPVKISPHVSLWRIEEIMALIASAK